MNKIKNSKIYKAIALALLFIVLSGAIYFFYKKTRPKDLAINTPEEHIIPAKPDTFDDSSKSLIETIKLARVATFRYDQEKARYYIKESLALWQDTVNEFINNPPKTVSDKEKWGRTVADIYRLIQESDNLLNKNDYTGAIDRLDKIRSMLNEVYDVAKNNPEANRLFPLLLTVKKIKESKTLAEAKPQLNDLKIKYTLFKELPNSRLQNEKSKAFEDIISEIENSTSYTFPRAIEKLEPAFFEIYEKY